MLGGGGGGILLGKNEKEINIKIWSMLSASISYKCI